MGINFMIFVNQDWEIAHKVGVNLSTERPAPIPDDLLQQLTLNSSFLAGRSGTDSVEGFLRIDNKILLTSAAPILRSDDSGPSRGFFVIGRYLDQIKERDLEEQSQLALSVFSNRSGDFTNDLSPWSSVYSRKVGQARFRKITRCNSSTIPTSKQSTVTCCFSIRAVIR
jgi:adenylate cyclase